MAQNMFILTCLSFSVLLLIFITQEIRPIDGRPLSVGKKNDIENQLQTRSKIYKNESTKTVSHDGHSTSGASSLIANNNGPPTVPPSVVIGSSQAPPPPAAHDVSDFRPTAPGHSPGVGHSIQN